MIAGTGEPWGIFCEYFRENSLRYNSTALYKVHPPLWPAAVPLYSVHWATVVSAYTIATMATHVSPWTFVHCVGCSRLRYAWPGVETTKICYKIFSPSFQESIWIVQRCSYFQTCNRDVLCFDLSTTGIVHALMIVVWFNNFKFHSKKKSSLSNTILIRNVTIITLSHHGRATSWLSGKLWSWRYHSFPLRQRCGPVEIDQ